MNINLKRLIMKKTGLILLALSIGVMFGCKTDNNNKKDELQKQIFF